MTDKKREAKPMPRSKRVIWAIARVTSVEILRDKILYNIGLFAFMLLAVSVLASQLTFIRPARVVLDFGLSAINISSSLIAILIGSGMLAREFERRTIFVALAHPISKMEFVAGKFLGLVAVVFLNWVLLVVAFLATLHFAADSVNVITPTLLLAVTLVFIESVLMAAFAILCSTFSTQALSIVMSIGMYMIGNNVSQIRVLAANLGSAGGGDFLKLITAPLPNLEFFNLGTKVTYGLPVTTQYAITSLAYGVTTTLALVLLAGLLIQAKEV